MYFKTYLQYRSKLRGGTLARGAAEHARALTGERVEPTMLYVQRTSLQQLQDSQRTWESPAIQTALEGQQRLNENKDISELIKGLEEKKSERLRLTYQDRGAAHYSSTYKAEEALKLAKVGLFKDVPVPFMRSKQRQSIEHHLDSILSEKQCGRSELMREAQLPDVRAPPARRAVARHSPILLDVLR